MDPFLNEDAKIWQPTLLKTRKKKFTDADASTGRGGQAEEAERVASTKAPSKIPAPIALVTYGSDSE